MKDESNRDSAGTVAREDGNQHWKTDAPMVLVSPSKPLLWLLQLPTKKISHAMRKAPSPGAHSIRSIWFDSCSRLYPTPIAMRLISKHEPRHIPRE
jgi:hypothetical protein